MQHFLFALSVFCTVAGACVSALEELCFSPKVVSWPFCMRDITNGTLHYNLILALQIIPGEGLLHWTLSHWKCLHLSGIFCHCLWRMSVVLELEWWYAHGMVELAGWWAKWICMWATVKRRLGRKWLRWRNSIRLPARWALDTSASEVRFRYVCQRGEH